MADAVETVEIVGQLIDGESVAAEGGEYFDVWNPSLGELLARAPLGTDGDVDRAMRSARRGQREWWSRSPYERERVLNRIGDLIAGDKERLARIESENTGKTLAFATWEVEFAAETFHLSAGHATRAHGEQIPLSDPGMLCYTRLEPVGVAGFVTSWNSPLVQAAAKAAGALAAGCGVVMKPAQEAPLTTIELARIAVDAGMPAGCFNVVTGGDETGAALSRHPRVDKLGFTGSFETGRSVLQALAATARPSAVELGGKAPNVVFPDIDLEASLDGILRGALYNSGQECCLGARLLVHSDVLEEFVGLASVRIRDMRAGGGGDVAREIGPLISAEHRARVGGFVERAVQEGATVCARGEVPERGFFYPATLLDRTTPSMEVWREEVFGPVLAVDSFDSDDEALEKANATRYGLAAGVWTADMDRAIRFVNELEAGLVWVNSYLEAISPAAPFGGGKDSGFGRELGRLGPLEFSQVKTAYVKGAPPRRGV
jgi:acyl-CoA reductase-like NAD-dependent aldehyde dehydrogenase